MKAILVVAVLVVSTVAFAAAEGWITVHDNCGGTFYLKADMYPDGDAALKAAEKYNKLRCQ
ncbi:hypothetical protein HX057_05710 [Myroides odoratimimus]|uniref:Uncharacterized protein n=3 Tax=Flavobacteriaceae TaxID=49546 RepID=A0AAI8C902_9FLAO|nr:hypothetical protein AS202_10400 [Myroides odoratimimus]APA92592.1 hypothetical protein BK054_10250 [Myroides sp. ZB35]EHO13580.1 hypothetical protein HMPREF9715_01118 [Myroides odoratimimus CIP 101113]EKB03301.1 hypothetical protein HMPREF9711_02628 [Myroides odoratimimus CCUG 3837]MCA4792135.1 hypothetical protein [Myroides odoratimimus]